MMNKFKMKTVFMLAGIMFSVLPFTTHAALDDIVVVALGSLDGRAVVKTTDGKMKVLKVGDEVPGSTARVKQILNDRLVVTEVVKHKGKQKQQMVWIYKPRKSGGKSRVQRLSIDAPKEERSIRLKTKTQTKHLKLKK